MKTTYELTSEARQGAARLTFEDQHFIAVEIEFKPPLDAEKTHQLLRALPAVEINIHHLTRLGLTLKKVANPIAPNEKLALFCRVYEKHKGLKYKVSAADSGKIKQINPTEEQLHAYFRSENFLFKGKQSIANLVKYWNEFRADQAGAGKKQYPNDWQPDLLKKLSPQETIHYYAHLKSLGLEPVKAGGQVVGFK